MFKRFTNIELQVLLIPDDGSGNNAGAGDLSKSDIIDILGEDDDKDTIPLGDDKDDKDDVDDKDDKDDDKDGDDKDDDDLKELEDDLENPDDVDLDDTETTVPRRSEILKAFPDVFKKFPYLEKAYFREQQYAEIFNTPQDAKAAADRSEFLEEFEEKLSKGDSTVLLGGLKESNQNGFHKFIDDFLPTLAEVDKGVYDTLVGNVYKHLIHSMIGYGRDNKEEAVEAAAMIMNRFVFNSNKVEGLKQLAGKTADEDPKAKEAEDKEAKFIQKQFDNHRVEMNDKVNSRLKNTVAANIDPKNQMSSYVKDVATTKAIDQVVKLIARDTRFEKILDRLWQDAIKDDFSRNRLDTITKAFFNRARTLLPPAIKKARIEALKGMNIKVREKAEDDDVDGKVSGKTTRDSGTRRSAAPETHSRKGPIKKASDIPSGMSSLDFLNSDD